MRKRQRRHVRTQADIRRVSETGQMQSKFFIAWDIEKTFNCVNLNGVYYSILLTRTSKTLLERSNVYQVVWTTN